MAHKFIDNNALLYIFTKIKQNFVAQEAGKGLSANDFTNELKSKLEAVEAGAQVNKLESVKVNGVAQTITEKGVDIAVPTKTSEITNDSGYLSVVSESNLDAALAEKVNAASEGNHSHANKALLDTYTQTEEDLADAVAKKHEHANKAELDLIASGDKAKWDKAVSDLADEIARAQEEEGKNAAAAAAAQGAADAAQGDVDALAGKVGDVAEGKTVVGMIAEAQAAATYDDTALKGRVAVIEGDYLKAADKTELEGKIKENGDAIAAIEADYLKAADKTELTEAIATAKQEAIEAVLGEGVNADFDTLKEVADWIQSDTTDSAALVTRVTEAEKAIDAIEEDYLKAADKTALQASITGNANAIADIQANYMKTADMVALTNDEIDAIFAQA